MSLTKLVESPRPAPGFGPNQRALATVAEVNRLIDEINDGGETISGPIAATGVISTTDTTDSTSKDTGSIITEGGIGVEKSVNIGETLTVVGLTTTSNQILKPTSATVASGGTITAAQLIGGLINATGATGNWQLPSAADITTAIGSTPAGTNFEFVFNATNMTVANTATLLVGASMTVSGAPALTGGADMTVIQSTQGTAGFRVVYQTPTACKIYRTW